MPTESKFSIDYLVGGLRISVDEDSATPGPRSHILNVIDAFRARAHTVRLHLANDAPGLARLRGAPEGGGSTNFLAPLKRVLIDIVRLLAAVWSGLWVRRRADKNSDVIYERAAVLQDLTAFHPNKRRAFKIVESNGIMSEETAQDRKALTFLSLAKFVERRLYRRADLIVSVSDPLARAIRDFAAVDHSKIVVVPNAISADLIKLPVTPRSVFKLGFIGSVVPWQRVEVMLLGLQKCKNRENMRASIVGAGSDLTKLRALARELGIDENVEFLGRLPRDAAIAEMRTWSVGYSGHVATTREDMYHSPLKIYEYAALGMAIVATDYADARELLADGCEIFIVETEDDVASALDRAFEIWTRNGLPLPELAHNALRNHTWNARVSQIEGAISTSLNGLRELGA
ncbi:glycosyltransferase [Microbacterium sp. NPDC090007]|uniref:glycosyltransferase n=1 Tax=Microbacterium sp. NPDC090007 TaxID=3364204 RepID=UPI00380CE13F